MTDARCVSPSRRGKRGANVVAGAYLDVDREIAGLAGRQHGVVTRGQLLALGIGEGSVERRLARGSLHSLHRGVYSVGHRVLTVNGRRMAAVLACGPGAALSHRSAGRLWRVVSPGDGWPEVTRPTSFRPRAGIVIHRSRLPLDEVTTVDGIPVTTVPRTVIDLAGTSTRRQVERMLHEVEVRQLWDRLSLWDLLERYPRRRGAGTLRKLLRGKEPTGITQNDFEELFATFLDEHGFPRPRLNATLPIRGCLLRPDCMWPEQRLIVELDGRAVHRTERAFEGDRQRDRILIAEGWRSVRVTWLQLRDEPEAIAADLRRSLRGSASPPTL